MAVERYFLPPDYATFPQYFSPPEGAKVPLVGWLLQAQEHRDAVANAIKEYGGVIFRGFQVTQEEFPAAFALVTGAPPHTYQGDTPRAQVGTNVYTSTAVAPERKLPLHQEVSGAARSKMPKYISFFCVNPSAPGTGQTLVGDAKRVTEAVRTAMPDFWQKLSTQTLTYTSRYLPSNSWRTWWIQWLNPSHATIALRFGTENKTDVEQKCREEGLDYYWDGKWLVTSQKGIPGTINIDGVTVFCNQIYTDKFNKALCGHGCLGWIRYFFARLILYPTSRSMQFDVEFDDGTPISRKEASQLVRILAEHEVGRDWEAGDMALFYNPWIMHGKTPHKNTQTCVRNLITAMNGSVI